MRITRGDIIIECDTQAELASALAVLMAPPAEIPLGTAELGEYLTEREEQRLRLVEPLPPLHLGYPPACGPAGDPRTDTVFPAGDPGTDIVQASPPSEHPAPQYVPVTRCCLDVLEAVFLFPEGVYAKGIGELLGISPKSKAVGGRLQKLATMGLVEHPHHNRNLWRATPLARRSKLVAC
jgi:hypothetical protein